MCFIKQSDVLTQMCFNTSTPPQILVPFVLQTRLGHGQQEPFLQGNLTLFTVFIDRGYCLVGVLINQHFFNIFLVLSGLYKIFVHVDLLHNGMVQLRVLRVVYLLKLDENHLQLVANQLLPQLLHAQLMDVVALTC